MRDHSEREEFLVQVDALSHGKNPELLTIERLEALLAKWSTTGTVPDEAGVLSGGEYRALLFAAGRERDLLAPVRDFLLLDGWLQRWVLETWGRHSLVGMRIG